MALQVLSLDILYNHHSMINMLQKITITIKHTRGYSIVKHVKFRALYKKEKVNRNRSWNPFVGDLMPPEEDPNTCDLIWQRGLRRGHRVRTKSYWISLDLILRRKGTLGHRHTRTKVT